MVVLSGLGVMIPGLAAPDFKDSFFNGFYFFWAHALGLKYMGDVRIYGGRRPSLGLVVILLHDSLV